MESEGRLTLAELKTCRNSVIGNRGAKARIGKDAKKVAQIVRCLDASNTEEARIEAAQIIASLSYGGVASLSTLLTCNVMDALLSILPSGSGDMSPRLLLALIRALRAVSGPFADLVGPSQWGLLEDRSDQDPVKLMAQSAMADVLSADSLDKLLQHLSPKDSSSMAKNLSTEVASIIGTVVRVSDQRLSVLDWLPPDQRILTVRPTVRRTSGAWGNVNAPRSPSAGGSWARGPPNAWSAGSPTKSRRGWEKTRAPSFSATSPLPTIDDAAWIVGTLCSLIKEQVHDAKLVEACLYALGALAKDSPETATYLNSEHSGPSGLAMILERAGDLRSKQVQVAACLAATETVRALPHFHGPDKDHSGQPSSSEKTIINILSMLITARPEGQSDEHQHFFRPGDRNFGEDMKVRERAAFVLTNLIQDSRTLILLAHERGVVKALVRVIRAVTPLPPQPEGGAILPRPEDEPEIDDEPLAITGLREAALTALATLCVGSYEIRRIAVEDTVPSPSPAPVGILPHITRSLHHPAVGVRYAAVQCVRALSRSVEVMRTSVSDSRCADVCFRILRQESQRLSAPELMDGAKEKKEDRRVVNAALMAVGNLVNDFSPIRKPYVDQGLVEILCVFLRDDLPDLEPNFRLNALWACKNLLVRAPPSLVSRVMKGVGWGRLQGFLSEETPSNIREQAFSLLRNIAYDDDGIHSVYSEFGIDFVLKALCSALEGTSEDVAVEAANLLGNLSNSTQEYANTVLLNPSSSEHTSHSYAAEMETSTPPILNAIKTALTEHTNPDLRRPLLFCLRRLSDSPKARRQLLEAGINGTLKRICQWGGKVPGVPGSRGGLSDDREVVDLAKAALSYLEHGGLEY